MKKIVIILIGCFLLAGPASSLVTVYYGTTFYGDHLELTFASNGYNMSYLEVGDNYFNIDNMYLNMTGLSSTFAVNVSSHNGSVNLSADTVVLRFNASYTGLVSFDFTGNTTHNAVYSVYDYTDTSNILSSSSADSIGKIDFDITFASEHDIEIELDYYLPDPPYNGSSNYDKDQNLNLSWSRGNYSDREVLVRKSGSYPSSSTDGTEVQNGTALYYNSSITSSGFYTVWSYNDTTGRFSATGLDIPWGALNISVYNQSKPWQNVTPFGLLISNQQGTSTYQNKSCSINHILDMLDIPYGTNTVIKINATGYKDTIIYKDLTVNNYFQYDFYLAPIETEVDEGGGDAGGSGTNYSTTEHYIVQVIDELNDPVQDAKVIIRFYNNYTEVWDEKSSFLTDGYGQGDVWLVPGVLYKVNISASGYDSVSGQDWTPVYIEYSDDRYKTFQLEFTEQDYDNATSYSYCIIFNGYISGGTAFVNYTDSCTNTIDTAFYVYEFNHSTNTSSLYSSWSNSSVNDMVVSFTVNTSNSYTVVLFLNHSSFGFVSNSFILGGHPWGYNKDVLTSKTEFNNVFDILGDNPFGWANVFGIFMLLVGLFAFGQRNIGVGMVMTGIIMVGIQAVIGIVFITFAAWTLLIVLGMLVQWHVNRRVERG